MNTPTNFKAEIIGPHASWPGLTDIHFTWEPNSSDEEGFYLERKQEYKGVIGWAGLVLIPPGMGEAIYPQGYPNIPHKPLMETYRVVAFRGPNSGPISGWDVVIPSNEVEVKTPVK